ncbi:hypothetical protein HXX76_016101 [Chlamydomonas incerta]|uniref:Uncharacterized protein n=1 Tax=Chlamydomonas incerta TaxID=51695 RepID=A0A835SB50_CHLIN|nr:hypothetical protein HXX76_016101 [Chlamydomonas incerta]|eukprot:KAG2422341.1 hypothetical protein HXX76_016101 [Chlamydomonas incerta]
MLGMMRRHERREDRRERRQDRRNGGGSGGGSGSGGDSGSDSSGDEKHSKQKHAPPPQHAPPPPAGYPPAGYSAPPPQAPAGYPAPPPQAPASHAPPAANPYAPPAANPYAPPAVSPYAPPSANPYAYGAPAAAPPPVLTLADQKYAAIAGRLRGTPGLVEDPAGHECFVPVGDVPGLLYLGAKCHERGLDVIVIITRPDTPMFLDFIIAGKADTKVLRQETHGEGRALAQGQLRAFQEISLENLAYDTDFSTITLYVFDRKPVHHTNAGAVVMDHGWRGALGFKEAAQTLTNIEVDHQEEEVYMPMPGGETVLMVDWDQGNVDIKLAVLAVPSTFTKAFELSIKGKPVKKYSRMYNPPKAKLGGRFQLARLYELDDMPYGTGFGEIEIHIYDISNTRPHSVKAALHL